MKALILDQSTTCTGFALVDSAKKGKDALIEYSFFKPVLTKEARAIECAYEKMAIKIKGLTNAVLGYGNTHTPNRIILEAIGNGHYATGWAGFVVGGLTFAIATASPVPVLYQPPQQRKVAVGVSGNDPDKAKTQAAVTKVFKLDSYPPPDTADALAGAYMWLVEQGWEGC